MLYIVVERITERLTYTLDWIFKEQLGVEYACVLRTDVANIDGKAYICYTAEAISSTALHIKPNGILEQTDIREQALAYHRWKHTAILFYNQPGAAVPFDLFGAVFFLLSRYEEYLRPTRDQHGRFYSTLSVAHQYAFLQEPVVDLWIQQLGVILNRNLGVPIASRTFSFVPTFDIDIASNYLEKPLWKHVLGGVRDALKGRLEQVKLRTLVYQGKAQDPYDNFDWMQAIHQPYQLKPIYFWLLSGNHTAFDTNNAVAGAFMQQLMQANAAFADYGIHPSYESHQSETILTSEIRLLEAVQRPVTRSRQHYIRFQLPQTYRTLINQGIQEDYSMGYADANGFRAGTSNSFLWFDLEANETTVLRVFPFVFMEATSIFYLKQSPEKALEELERLYWAVRKTNSQMITVFHNYTLGESGMYKGWRSVYQQLLDLATSNFEPKVLL